MGSAHGSCDTIAFCRCLLFFCMFLTCIFLKVACFSLVHPAVHDGFWLYFEEAAGITQAERCLR